MKGVWGKLFFKKVSPKKNRSPLTTRDLCVLGLCAALLIASKYALSFVPYNIEAVSLLTVIFTLAYGWLALFPVFVFVLLEGFLYGFGLWWYFWLIAWPLLALLAQALKPLCRRSAFAWAFVLGLYGLAFGALYALVALVVGGMGGFFAVWTAGLIFDVLHCVGNFVLCLILFAPLMKLMERAIGER
ncbi:MAG: hypothetical protein FWE69_08670 [Clostridiales bacterium]|nr:hypothetical protein [Clostridiales bacterium]